MRIVWWLPGRWFKRLYEGNDVVLFPQNTYRQLRKVDDLLDRLSRIVAGRLKESQSSTQRQSGALTI
jgi:hypothetical protein